MTWNSGALREISVVFYSEFYQTSTIMSMWQIKKDSLLGKKLQV